MNTTLSITEFLWECMSLFIHSLKDTSGSSGVWWHFFFYFFICLNCILSVHCCLPLCQCAGVCLWSGLILCPRGLVRELGDGERCIIHKCVPPCAWAAVTRSCQQCILERDSSGCGEDTPQGLLACAGLWAGPRGGGTGLLREDWRVIWMQKTTENDTKTNINDSRG